MVIDAAFLFLLGTSTLLIQLLGFPLLLAFFGKGSSQPEWWAWGRMAGWLTVGLVVWFMAHMGIPVNSTVGFWLIFLGGLLAVYTLLPINANQNVRRFLRLHRRQVLIQEGIFMFGFIFLGLVRTFHPEVLDLEKFMNAGLMQGYLRSPTLPAVDFWLAGETINYYSYGHFLNSLLLRFWNVPVEVGFNVLLGWIMGLVLVEGYALGQTLLRSFLPRQPLVAWSLFTSGLISALLIVFGGNSHPVWYFFQNLSFKGYWYPDVTRFIDHTIHEIPAYSFIVSDLHAHFISLSIVLLTIFMAWRWMAMIFAVKETVLKRLWKKPVFISTNLVLGGLLGILGMTNTWDMLIYSVLLVILGSFIIITEPKKLLAVLVSSLQISVMALLTVAPWLLNFSSIVNGIFLVPERSPLWQLAALWLGQVIFSLAAVGIGWYAVRKQLKFQQKYLFILGLGTAALLFLILPEIIYFKDIYPTFPRANTMFKFAFQAFVMMNLLIGWLVGMLIQQTSFLTKRFRFPLLLFVVFFLAMVLAYPFLGYPNYYGGFKKRTGLDGLAWLRQAAPQEYEAILWLREEVADRPVVLEAVGDSYTEYGRVSVFSGLPTVLGWRAHEWLWRGGYEIPRERTEEVKTVYEFPRSLEALAILEKYQIQFIFVGGKERATYLLDQSGLQSLGETVFYKGRVLIIKRAL